MQEDICCASRSEARVQVFRLNFAVGINDSKRSLQCWCGCLLHKTRHPLWIVPAGFQLSGELLWFEWKWMKWIETGQRHPPSRAQKVKGWPKGRDLCRVVILDAGWTLQLSHLVPYPTCYVIHLGYRELLDHSLSNTEFKSAILVASVKTLFGSNTLTLPEAWLLIAQIFITLVALLSPFLSTRDKYPHLQFALCRQDPSRLCL